LAGRGGGGGGSGAKSLYLVVHRDEWVMRWKRPRGALAVHQHLPRPAVNNVLLHLHAAHTRERPGVGRAQGSLSSTHTARVGLGCSPLHRTSTGKHGV
jgi:hypothetical protein